MSGIIYCRISILVLVFGLVCNSNAGDAVFSRTRHKAGLLAMIEYNDSPTFLRNYSCKKAQITGICRMMVQEGGYEPNRLYKILNISDPEVEYVAMIIDELEGDRKVPRPGSLTLASLVAFAYTVPSPDGMRAAVHAGRLGGVDEDCDAVCRAVYSLLIYAIEGQIESKEDLIKVAALNAESDKVGRIIRSVRLAEWRKLPDESTLAGRLARVLFLWTRSKDFSEAISMGSRKLLYPESRKLLAVLSAIWTDLPYLPENFVWKALMEKDNREICAELYKLSEEAILAGVSEEMVYGSVNATYDKSIETINGQPLDSENAGYGQNDYIEIAAPAAPEVPRAPTMPVVGSVRTNTTATAPQSPGYDVLKSLEDTELSAMSQMPSLGADEVDVVRVVKPVDIFGDHCFVE